MKVFLLYPDRDFNLKAELPPQSEALIQDLGIDILLDAMAQGDSFLRAVAKQVLCIALKILSSFAIAKAFFEIASETLMLYESFIRFRCKP